MPSYTDLPDLNDPCVARMAQDYPHLKIKDGKSGRHAFAAKNARILLKKAFPNVPFLVTSDTYSGGSSITVKWDLWPEYPTSDQVQKVIDRFSTIVGSAVDDSNVYDRDPDNNAFRSLFGQVSHAMTASVFRTPQEIVERETEQLLTLTAPMATSTKNKVRL